MDTGPGFSLSPAKKSRTLHVPDASQTPSRWLGIDFSADMWAGVGRGGAEMSCSCVAGGAWGLRRWSWMAGEWTTACWAAMSPPPLPSQQCPLTSGSQRRPSLHCQPLRGLLFAAVGKAYLKALPESLGCLFGSWVEVVIGLFGSLALNLKL